MTRQRSRWLRLLAVLFALTLVAAACGDSDDSSSDDTSAETPAEADADAGDDASDDGADEPTNPDNIIKKKVQTSRRGIPSRSV